MTRYKSKDVELLNFWSDGHVGHADWSGRDVGKEFLFSLFLNESRSLSKGIRVTSHFFPPRKINLIRKIIETLFLNQVAKRRKMYGYSTTSYQLDHRYSNIWYTSENMRPPLEEKFQAFLSHDLDPYDGRNVYFPIWASRLGVDLEKSEQFQSLMLSERKVSRIPQENICAVISNPEPIRMAFIKQLQEHFPVDVYGALGFPISSKDEVLKRYKINICFENDEFPGYVTEKPFEAWLNGCVPVWRGLDNGGFLNNHAIIDVTKLGFNESILRISRILNDDSEYLRMSSLPILQKGYDFQRLKRTVSELCSE